jgi:two-component system phosphate regulon sensor histidine kinase PhoR
LALVKRIVERHGGDVRVQSRVGEGSTFTVYLPLSAPPNQASGSH